MTAREKYVPKATVVTALLRMRDAGDVRAFGSDRYIWAEYYTDEVQMDADAIESIRQNPLSDDQPEALTVAASP